MNNNNEFRCNCVEMTRAIKDKIDKELENMSVVEYLRRKEADRNSDQHCSA
jgi:hypothetical protein